MKVINLVVLSAAPLYVHAAAACAKKTWWQNETDKKFAYTKDEVASGVDSSLVDTDGKAVASPPKCTDGKLDGNWKKVDKLVSVANMFCAGATTDQATTKAGTLHVFPDTFPDKFPAGATVKVAKDKYYLYDNDTKKKVEADPISVKVTDTDPITVSVTGNGYDVQKCEPIKFLSVRAAFGVANVCFGGKTYYGLGWGNWLIIILLIVVIVVLLIPRASDDDADDEDDDDDDDKEDGDE